MSVQTSLVCSKEAISGFDALLETSVDQNTIHIDENKEKFSSLKRFSGIIYLLISSLLFTITNFILKQLQIDILDVIIIRSFVQIILFIGFFLYKRYHPFSSQYFHFLMFIYSFFAAMGTVSFYSALSYITLPDLNTIRYTQVIWTALLAFIVFRERITLPILLACILTLIGVICVVQPTFLFSQITNLNVTLPKTHENRLFGMLIALLCAISLSLSIVLNKKLHEKKFHQSIIMFFFILTSCFILLIIQTYKWIFYKMNDPSFDMKQLYLTRNFLLATILGTSQLIPMILTQKSIKREHPSIISVIQACDILFTIILQKFFSTTILNLLTLIGSTLVLTSIVIVGIHKLWQDRCKKHTHISP